MNLADQIKNARTRAGLTCGQLARRAWITVRSVHYYESGERTPSVETLKAISRVTGVMFKVGEK
jgi:transcriptional regulator with XRE-family HTH domain